MKLIYEQTKNVKQILPKQNIDEAQKYRRIFYLTERPVNDGVLLLNTVTYEFIFLNTEEIGLLNDPDLNNATVRYLVEQYFLVPENFDDKKFAFQVTDARIQIQNIFTNPPLSFFVILTTTGCNARCFYCFEQGAKVSNMTEQTAHDVADFIERKGAEKIKIQWFGGEPLINIKAIDTISKDLAAKNIDFSSTMVSNGYLLDEEAIKKAVDLWKLERIQITLDGTEEIYNKIKNYVYKDVSSPFIRVLNNIENALKAGIQINIRLNMDEHNSDDLFDLSKLLVERFSKYQNCYIYVVRLFEDTCSKIKNREVNDRHKLIENSIKLQNYINCNMPKPDFKELGKSFANPNTCMACSDNAVMIVPDGHLGKCEHFVDSDFYGSIYSDEIDLKKITKYKERKTVCSECDDCELRSLCIHLKCCTGVPHHCDAVDKKAIKTRLDSKLINVYNKFLEIEN
ncbi:MAG: radical SAM protein [Ruminococcaceae bacterium]|nr:radical SAM protein [Oscillospiraceae bacterium]